MVLLVSMVAGQAQSPATPLQAIEAEQKEDREIVCAEVFSDVTGELDDQAKGKPLAGSWGPAACAATSKLSPYFCPLTSRHLAEKLQVTGNKRFYEVLAPYFNKVWIIGCCI